VPVIPKNYTEAPRQDIETPWKYRCVGCGEDIIKTDLETQEINLEDGYVCHDRQDCYIATLKEIRFRELMGPEDDEEYDDINQVIEALASEDVEDDY
jgi:DNA-directed RNA polymerase subunit RPC12/RpoP